MDLWFTPRPIYEFVGFSDEWKVDPNDPDKVIGHAIYKLHMPDPKRCGIITNISDSGPASPSEE